MLVVRAQAASLWGVEALEVDVEVFRTAGLPGVNVVGLARGATRESWVRVRAALGQLGVSLATLHLVVNLVPADRPKTASTLELALAVATMAAAGRVSPEALAGRRFWGEVGLDGRLLPSPGALLVADLARARGERELVLPLCEAADAARVPGVRIIGARDLDEVARHLRGEAVLPAAQPPTPTGLDAALAPGASLAPCLSDVVGQAQGRRALELAAAGGHNLLLVGPPGSGKTLLARALRRLLPPLDLAAQVEVLRVRAAAAACGAAAPALGEDVSLAPFRSPHHASTQAALLGGGSQVRPGEVSLAHRGVLFLDELPEFARGALDGLREPLEEGAVHLARAQKSVTYPARVLLVAAMNPCPCGHFAAGGAPRGKASSAPACLCPFDRVQRYRSKVSAPLLQRIDLHVAVQAVPYRALREAMDRPRETSEVVRARVVAARAHQAARQGAGRCNAELSAAEVARYAVLGDAAQQRIEAAMDKGTLSMRALGRLCRVARTIADLRLSDALEQRDVDEALSYVACGTL